MIVGIKIENRQNVQKISKDCKLKNLKKRLLVWIHRCTNFETLRFQKSGLEFRALELKNDEKKISKTSTGWKLSSQFKNTFLVKRLRQLYVWPKLVVC